MTITPATEAMREALRPFADKAAQFNAQPDGIVTVQMDFAHFRRARAALTALPTNPGGQAAEQVRGEPA